MVFSHLHRLWTLPRKDSITNAVTSGGRRAHPSSWRPLAPPADSAAILIKVVTNLMLLCASRSSAEMENLFGEVKASTTKTISDDGVAVARAEIHGDPPGGSMD